MQSSFIKDVYIILILSLITVCLWSYLLIPAQKIPARNAMGAHVQDFVANIHPESIHSSNTECIHFPHALTHSLLKTSDSFGPCVVEQLVTCTNGSPVVSSIASCPLHPARHAHLPAGIFS